MTKKEIRKMKKNAKKAKKVAKKLGWKKILIILAVIVAIIISFFGFCYFKYDDAFYFFRPKVEDDTSSNNDSSNNSSSDQIIDGSEQIEFDRIGKFEHKFNKDEMSNKALLSVNGLDFNIPNMVYNQNENGVILGDLEHPILDSNPWTIETTFKETILTYFKVELTNNKNGESKVTINIDDKKYEKNLLNSASYYSLDNLNIPTSNFKLSISNTKGGTIKSLRLEFKNPEFNVKIDTPKTTGVGIVPGQGSVKGKDKVPNTFYAVINKNEYYKNIDFSSNKNDLQKSLNTLINTDTKFNSYGDAKTMLIYTDERIYQKGKLNSIYDDNIIDPVWDGNVWNREHVWPCNKMRRPGLVDDTNYRPKEGTKDYRSDLHNLRVLTKSTNSSRSDKYYDTKTTNTTYYPNLTTNRDKDYRGDVARILFYMALRYDDLELVETPVEKGAQMGKLSLLKKWNLEDPVDEFEIQRNNRIFEYQGNRNPFIDYPELGIKLY